LPLALPRRKFDKMGDICTRSAKPYGIDHDEVTWQSPKIVFDQLPEQE
jgi:hypothetical protein